MCVCFFYGKMQEFSYLFLMYMCCLVGCSKWHLNINSFKCLAATLDIHSEKFPSFGQSVCLLSQPHCLLGMVGFCYSERGKEVKLRSKRITSEVSYCTIHTPFYIFHFTLLCISFTYLTFHAVCLEADIFIDTRWILNRHNPGSVHCKPSQKETRGGLFLLISIC